MLPQKQFEDIKPDRVIDPVCGMTVKPETAAGSFEYDGRTHYFCSTHCLNKFSNMTLVIKHKVRRLIAD